MVANGWLKEQITRYFIYNIGSLQPQGFQLITGRLR